MLREGTVLADWEGFGTDHVHGEEPGAEVNLK